MTTGDPRLAAFSRLLDSSSTQGPLAFELMSTADARWRDAYAAGHRQPVGYAPVHVAYQHAYFTALCPDYVPLDCLILWQGRPIGIWSMAYIGEPGKERFSSNLNGSSGVSAPWISDDLPEKTSKAAARQWLTLLGHGAATFGIDSLRLRCPPATGALSHWQRLAMELGAELGGSHRASVDLNLSETDYHGRLRKSYKALINSAKRLWQVGIDDTGCERSFRAFEALHLAVAGRRTRPESSWRLQYESILSGDAFAIYLRDPTEKLVGASLFNRSRDEVSYAVGVYDRKLFDRPLAHLSLYTAIAHARTHKAQTFILGERAYPNDAPAPSDKELRIAYFKEGFATEILLVPFLNILSHQLSEATKN